MKIKTIKYEVEIGVDVSKKTIDACSVEGKTFSYNNTKKGIAAMFKKHDAKDRSIRVTCESTGTYSSLLIKECLLKDVPISQVNPLLIKNYIKSFGCLAKTDPIDANFIRKYALERTPKTIETNWLEQDVFKQYQRRKTALIKERAMLKTSRDKYDEPFIIKDITREISRLGKRIAIYEENINKIIAKDPNLTAKKEILERTVGVGPGTSTAIIVHMPELGELCRGKVTGLAGLAPYAQDSGVKKGKRFIKGGRTELRTALYMAAISSIRHNKHLKAFYQQLKARGKASRVAIIAVCRKLLIHLNSELKNNFVRI